MQNVTNLYITGFLLSLLFMVGIGFSAPFPIKIAYILVGGAATYAFLLGFFRENEYVNAIKKGGTYYTSYDYLPTDKMLVGRGFLWTPAHTKKTSLLMQNTEMLQQGAKLGGLSFMHGIGIHEEKDIHIPLSELVGHTIYQGTTRVGKTRGYEIPITQAIKRKEATIVLDPKGDVDLLNRVVEACRVYGRENDFIFFALPYPRLSAYYNPLKNFTLPNEIPDRIAMLLPSGGSSDSFRAFSWQVVSAVNNALLFLEERPTVRSVYDYSLNRMDELCRKSIEHAFNKKGMLSVLEDAVSDMNTTYEALTKSYIALYKKNIEVHNELVADLISIASHPKEHFQKMSASLTPTLAKLAVGEIGHLLSSQPEDDKKWIDWEMVTKKKKVVYMFFGSLMLRETAKYVIRMTLQDFTSHVGTKYSYEKNKEPINLFIDEFSEAVDGSFANLLNKCGGANVRMFLASQSVADTEAELGSEAKSQQIFDNLNNKFWLRCSDVATAEVFSNASGDIAVTNETTSSSVTPDISDSSTVYRSSYAQGISKEKRPLIDPTWILKLPKGQGFLASSGRVFKMRIPLLPECKVKYLEEIGIHDTEVFNRGVED